MKIFLVHNFYQQRGGEDESTELEVDLLRSRGHPVVTYMTRSESIRERPLWEVASKTVWNQAAYHEIRASLREHQPDVVHVQNFFPVISPSVYYAAYAEGVPVVQTLHNYRLLCPNALFFRDGQVCEDCLGKALPYPGVVHACYRGSRPASAVVASMLATHRAMDTWREKVTLYIALTNFARNKFIEGGLPAEKIRVKPHFLEPPSGTRESDGSYALFIGRLSREKGVHLLVDAWCAVARQLPLRIIGDGPLRAELQVRVAALGCAAQVTFLGEKARNEVQEALRCARFLVFPSLCYETFGRVAIEAFAWNVPVIASRLGAMEEVVDHGKTGLHFTAGDAEDLERALTWALENPAAMLAMGRNAREEYDEEYTPQRNYVQLMDVYQEALAIQRQLAA